MRRAQKLNKLWHSALPETHYGNLVGNKRHVAYEAEFNGVAYAVAIWTTPIASNRIIGGFEMLELRRMAISDEAPKNTASRMLSVMVKMIKKKFPDVTDLISYQAENIHSGTIYKASGWRADNRSEQVEWHKGHRAKPQIESAKIRWRKKL